MAVERENSHHHKSSGPSLGIPATSAEKGVLLCGAEGVSFAVNLVVHFEIVILEDYAAFLIFLLVSALLMCMIREVYNT